MERRINNSEIQSFKWCRRNWFFAYYLGKDALKESKHQWLGSLIHSYMEAHNTGKDWKELIPEQSEDKDFDVELSVKMMEGYVEWLEETGADAHLTPLLVEEKVEYTFPKQIRGRTVILTAKTDRVMKDTDDQIHLEDTKTTQNLGDLANRRLRLNEQLLTYAILLRLVLGMKITNAYLNVLRKVKRTGTAKPPFYDRLDVQFNDTHLRNHYRQLEAVIEDIFDLEDKIHGDLNLAIKYAYPTVSRDCDWKCAFAGICPLMDDGSNIEWAIENLYKEREYVA